MIRTCIRLSHKGTGQLAAIFETLSDEEKERYSRSYDIDQVVIGPKEEFDYELGRAYDAGFAAGRNYEEETNAD